MNTHKCKDLGSKFPGKQFIAVIESCNKNSPIVYDVVPARKIEQVVKKFGGWRVKVWEGDENFDLEEVEFLYQLDEKKLKAYFKKMKKHYIFHRACKCYMRFFWKDPAQSIFDILTDYDMVFA